MVMVLQTETMHSHVIRMRIPTQTVMVKVIIQTQLRMTQMWVGIRMAVVRLIATMRSQVIQMKMPTLRGTVKGITPITIVMVTVSQTPQIQIQMTQM